MEACRFPFSVDEADTSCECCAIGEEGARNSVDGIIGENVGLTACVSNNGLGDSGDSAGEAVVSSGAAEGMMEIIGESAIEGAAATGEAGET